VGLEQRFQNYAEAIPVEFDAAERRAIAVSDPFLKRLLDIAIAFTLLITLAPLLLLVAILIRLDSAGPVLFRQTRLGVRGKPFDILKFRTMSVLENGDSIRQATRNDPRITRIGGFLRKVSIDELPQLINVLKGEMSLVGPRPHARAHDAYYSRRIDGYNERQHVRPGITGWAQVHGCRGETRTLDDMRRRVEYDLWYVRHASVMLDLEILFRTVREVVRPRNAQ
jgi:exopolysaccharide biosynthesis polyprenyl glycosylphosphotransferase